MHSTLKFHSPKKSANLTVSAELLNTAKQMDINLSAIFEQALASAVSM